MDRHVEEILVNRPLLDAQHAYRKERSTEITLHEAVGFVEEGIQKRGMVIATLIDIMDAFKCTIYAAI